MRTSPSGQVTPRPPEEIKSNLLRSFLRSVAIPTGVLIFFALAPRWLDYRLHSGVAGKINAGNLAAAAKAQQVAAWAKVDFGAVCAGYRPELQRLREGLESGGICAHFQRLQWGLWLSIALM